MARQITVNMSHLKEFNENCFKISEEGLKNLRGFAMNDIPVMYYDDIIDYNYDIGSNLRYRSIQNLNKIGVTKSFNENTMELVIEVNDNVDETLLNIEKCSINVRGAGQITHGKTTVTIVDGDGNETESEANCSELILSDTVAIDFVLRKGEEND